MLASVVIKQRPGGLLEFLGNAIFLKIKLLPVFIIS